MTRPKTQISAPGKPRKKDSATRSDLLTLDKAGPIQMGFWVPNRVWATAKFLVPLRDYIAAKRKAGTLAPMQPVMQNFKNWVTSNSDVSESSQPSERRGLAASSKIPQ